MRRRGEKRPRIDLAGPEGGLSSNPFASLSRRRARTSSPDPDAPAQESASPKPSGSETVEVRFERKGRGGKAVTVVRWLSDPPSDDALQELARACARALGAGARGEAGSLVIQGRQVDRVAMYLADRLGVTVKRGTS